MMKLYTKTGDDGTTGLFGGERIRKDHPRVDAYGAVDEINAAIGVAVVIVKDERLSGMLGEIQADLFSLGAELATPDASKLTARVADEAISRLEAWIDDAEAALPPLRTFIVPGGSETASRLHLARTVCRRAERSVVTLMSCDSIRPQIMIYLNRLGDLLFALARRANQDVGVPDVPWTAPPAT